jgi:uncharacterized protein YkwD
MDIIGSLLSNLTSLAIPVIGFNWIDIVVLVMVLFYSIQGFSLGFITAFVDFLSFAFSFLLGILLYSFVSQLLVKYLSVPQGFANAIGFFAIAVVFEVIFTLLIRIFLSKLPIFHLQETLHNSIKIVGKFLGIIPGILSGLLLASFILSLIIALPLAVFLKHSVTSSKIGSILVANTQSFNKSWQAIFGGAFNDTLSFLTVEPKSNELVNLNFKTSKISVDKNGEKQMFELVNTERVSRGEAPLVDSISLTKVAQDHCTDMFTRGYFSHYTPEGLSPFDRMAQVDIVFNYAGENLALAPSVDLAMKGLMQSIGHKENILSANFHQLGVGVIDGGIYGEMYCQEFSN